MRFSGNNLWVDGVSQYSERMCSDDKIRLFVSSFQRVQFGSEIPYVLWEFSETIFYQVKVSNVWNI